MKRMVTLFAMLAVAVSMVHAQKVYASVYQNGEELTQLGVASFDVDYVTEPVAEFINGRVVVKIGKNKVATLPMRDGGALVMEYDTEKEEAKLDKVTKSPTEAKPYATIHSPYQLVVPEGCEVYAPTFDEARQVLLLLSSNRLPAGAVVPAETPLVVKGTTSVDFTISSGTPTCAPSSALKGTSLRIDTPSKGTVYTFGRDRQDASRYGLFKYVAAKMPAGVAYLQTSGTASARQIDMEFDGAATAVDAVESPTAAQGVRKYVADGNVVIERNGKRYNLNGQEIR